MPCVGLPICFGIAGVAQLWDLMAHIMYLQDLWRPWLRGLKYVSDQIGLKPRPQSGLIFRTQISNLFF